MAFRPFVIDTLDIDPATWTAYSPTIPCNQISIRSLDGTNSFKMRTDPAESDQEDTISAGQQVYLSGRARDFSGGALTAFRFSPGVAMAYFQSVAGTGPLKIWMWP